MSMHALDSLLNASSSWENQVDDNFIGQTVFPPVCDLVVVGGGVTGLSAALEGASHGLSVVRPELLEIHVVFRETCR